jgi:hypothetical protein
MKIPQAVREVIDKGPLAHLSTLQIFVVNYSGEDRSSEAKV